MASPTQRQHPPATSMTMVNLSGVTIPVLLAPREEASASTEPYKYLFNSTHRAQAGIEATVDDHIVRIRRSIESLPPRFRLEDPLNITLWQVRRGWRALYNCAHTLCSSTYRARSLVQLQQRLRRRRPMHLSLSSTWIPTPNLYHLINVWKTYLWGT